MNSQIEHELNRRLELYNKSQALAVSGLNKPSDLKELGIYGGASGVWVNKIQTSNIDPAGVAVGLLHTGRHYDDDVDESGILYHYPTTNRPESRDQNEIEAIKNLGKFKLPVFVIRNVGQLRKVELAWLDDFDDSLRICVLTFHGFDPAVNPFRSETTVQAVQLFGNHRKTKSEVIRAERDPKFKFQIMQRFDGICVATGTDVFQVLDAAHIIPVANRGTESAENGLLLTASAHRSFDANLWGINPETLKLETQPDGPGLDRLRIGISNLKHIESKLNRDALEYRYKNLFLRKSAI
jgi:hypothetical protein